MGGGHILGRRGITIGKLGIRVDRVSITIGNIGNYNIGILSITVGKEGARNETLGL